MWGGVFPRTYSYSGSVYVRKEVFLKETIEEMVHDWNRTSDNSADDRRNVWVLGEGEGRRRTRSRDDVNRMRCVHVGPCEFEMVRARRGQDVCKSRVVVNTANGTTAIGVIETCGRRRKSTRFPKGQVLYEGTSEMATVLAGLARSCTGRFVDGLVSVRAVMSVAKAIVFQFTINCHVSSILATRIPSIPRIYNRRFYLKAFTYQWPF